MRSKISTFIERLKVIGLEVELHGNYPWVYLYSVNGNKIKEKFYGNHGFTAFWATTEDFTDRREVFKIVRKYCGQ